MKFDTNIIKNMAETVAQLRDEYKELIGKKPHHSWDKAKLEELIQDAKNQNSETEGDKEPESKDQEVDEKTQVSEVKKEMPPEEPTVDGPKLPKGGDNFYNDLPVFDGGNGLRAGRHLVFRDGKPIYWRNSVIETYLRRNGIDSLEFPPNTKYIQENIKHCKDCG